MKQIFFSVLAFKPWLVNTGAVAVIALVFWIGFGFAKCEYPTGSYDLPFHARFVLTLLSTAIFGLVLVSALDVLRLLKP